MCKADEVHIAEHIQRIVASCAVSADTQLYTLVEHIGYSCKAVSEFCIADRIGSGIYASFSENVNILVG